MNREILFRGKRTDNGEWIESFTLLNLNEYLYMFQTAWGEITYDLQYNITAILGGKKPFLVEVIPETVGQYTGLKDKNGRKIFEGDIVKFKHGGEFGERGIYFRNYVVEFINTYVTYGLRLRNRSIHFPFKQATATMHDAVVVGNVYDNPELLKGDDEDE